MTNMNKARELFENKETAPETESVLTGTKVVTAVSLIGTLASGGLFGYGLYTGNSSLMAIFGFLGLLCAGFFLGNAVKMKTNKK